jgi:hypothetical protein
MTLIINQVILIIAAFYFLTVNTIYKRFLKLEKYNGVILTGFFFYSFASFFSYLTRGEESVHLSTIQIKIKERIH